MFFVVAVGRVALGKGRSSPPADGCGIASGRRSESVAGRVANGCIRERGIRAVGSEAGGDERDEGGGRGGSSDKAVRGDDREGRKGVDVAEETVSAGKESDRGGQ